MADARFNTPKKVTSAFAGALLVFGITFYAVKQNIARKRKAELYDCQARKDAREKE
ncbi:hypothetical protein AX15_000442 [Amanita polypyramis BW_CC]|nr:hypothetical protein AX15_000442 [Amanita polypyramis BW_CC]